MALSARNASPAIAGTRQLLGLTAGALALGYSALAGLILAARSSALLARAGHELLAFPGALGFVACPLRRFTGIACPACGATHAALALLRCDLRAALTWNPFLVLALAALVAIGVAALAAPRFAERWLARAGDVLRSHRGRWLLALALVLTSAWQTVRLPG